MDGVFIKGRFSAFFNILGLVSGLFLTALFGWLLLSGEFQTLDDRLLSAFFAGFGIFVVLFCGLSLWVSRKVRIHLDDKGITAFCHYGLKLSCTYSEIRSVTYGGTGLNIHLASGNRYNLMHLQNACALGRYIERRIPEQQEEMPLSQILSLRLKCKWEGICAMAGFPLLIPLAIFTSALTGWKELHQFSARDWQVFGILGTLCLALIAATCISLRRYLLHSEQLHSVLGSAHQHLLRTAPLLPGNAIALYLDDMRHASLRLTVFGYPNMEDVYFTVEQVSCDFQLECIHRSDLFPSIRDLAPELEGMIPIPLPGAYQKAER